MTHLFTPEQQKLAKETQKRKAEENKQALVHMLAQTTPAMRTRIEGVPIKFRFAYARSVLRPETRANAIRMKCYECVGFEQIQESVGGCRVFSCPLWHVRPIKTLSQNATVSDDEPSDDAEEDQQLTHCSD